MSSRREFLRAAGAAAVTRTAFGQAQNRKLKLGLIGAGWYGNTDLQAAWKVGNVECVALSDVDSEHLDTTAAECEKAQGSRPKGFKDYRELLNVPGLDAVIVATPPQWHALQFIDICKRGLPVYQEKPLAYDIREGRAMVDAWKKAGNIVQVGFQRRHATGYMAAKKYIESGQAGRIVQVDAQIHFRAATPDPKPQNPPPTLDWDLWCGPAPKLPYSPAIGHKSWRLEKEYGNGHLVDWGIHLIDAIRVILGESVPRTVQAVGGIYEYKGLITTPDTLTANFEFARCPVVWRHRLWGAAEYTAETQNGIFLFGDKQTVFVNDQRCVAIPRGKQEQITIPVEKADAGLEHMREFLEAVRGQRQPGCSPEDAFKSTQTVQLGMIAYNAGGRIEWDAAKETIPGNAAASRFLKREYRTPYRHPYSLKS